MSSYTGAPLPCTKNVKSIFNAKHLDNSKMLTTFASVSLMLTVSSCGCSLIGQPFFMSDSRQ